MQKNIEIKRGNVVVKITPQVQRKGGKVYVRYVVMDYTEGTRKQRSFADLRAAKAKAGEIAEALATGEQQLMVPLEGLRLEVRRSLEMLAPIGLDLLPATTLLVQATRILGGYADLLAACQHFKRNRPDRPITPLAVEEAVKRFLEKQTKRISYKRGKTITSYLGHFVRKFANQPLDQIGAAELTDFVAEQSWSAKTANDILNTISLLYKEAQLRCWVPEGFNPAERVDRRKEVRGPVHVYEPWEARQILDRLALEAPELVPAVALWLFSGIRRSEIARVNWPQINRALRTGYVELEGRQTKTGQERTVPVCSNLREWLLQYRKDSGSVMPPYWLEPTKSAENRLAELPRFIARTTGVVWRDNAPRHSFASYHFKLHGDHGETIKAMGTSLRQFERHYWNKTRVISKENAADWFNILPEQDGKLIPLGAIQPHGSPALPKAKDDAEVSVG